MIQLSNSSLPLISAAKIKMESSFDGMVYTITDFDRFSYTNELVLAYDNLYINGKPCFEVFTSQGINHGGCLFKAKHIDGGTQYTKVV